MENKKEGKDSLRAIRDRLGVGPLSTITIQDMLKGVKDSHCFAVSIVNSCSVMLYLPPFELWTFLSVTL